nr:WAP four-disulfide core domain protein 3-like isoform X1 [Biomphalaria glabrata]
MKTAIFGLVLLLVASTFAISLPGIMIGTCAEMCSNNLIIRAVRGLGGCPDGYVCASNGCGHSCQPILLG